MTGFLLCLILLIPYFFPTIVAVGKGGRSSYVISMFLLNLLVGWTVIGWIVILICAANVKPTVTPVMVTNTNSYPLPPPLVPELPKIEVIAAPKKTPVKSGERFDFASQKWVDTYTSE